MIPRRKKESCVVRRLMMMNETTYRPIEAINEAIISEEMWFRIAACRGSEKYMTMTPAPTQFKKEAHSPLRPLINATNDVKKIIPRTRKSKEFKEAASGIDAIV